MLASYYFIPIIYPCLFTMWSSFICMAIILECCWGGFFICQVSARLYELNGSLSSLLVAPRTKFVIC